jgi:hypothetical protein
LILWDRTASARRRFCNKLVFQHMNSCQMDSHLRIWLNIIGNNIVGMLLQLPNQNSSYTKKVGLVFCIVKLQTNFQSLYKRAATGSSHI